MRSIVIALCALLMVLPARARAEFLLGVGVHESSERTVTILSGLGVNSVRNDFAWRNVEKEKGSLTVPEGWPEYLQKLSQAKIVPMMILDYGNRFYDGGGKPVTREGIAAFARYSRFSAQRLTGVKHFEVWNEWYHHAAPPSSPESYLVLLQAVAPELRGVGRELVVLAGAGMHDGWAETFVRLGGLEHADGLSIHPYVHCLADSRPEVMFAQLTEFSAQLKKANGGREVPLYVTEMGWPSHQGACGSSPEQAAQYLARSLLLVRTLPEVKGYWWYDLRNDGRDIQEREHNFGLLDHDYRPKPASHTLKDLAPVILQGKSFARVPAPSGVVAVAITDREGEKTFAVWNETGAQTKTSLSVVPGRVGTPAVRKIRTGGQPSKLTVRGTPLVIKKGAPVTVGAEPPQEEAPPLILNRGRNQLSLDGTPLLVTGAHRLEIGPAAP